ncbi:MAG: aminopeptidase P family protein [Pelagibacteraceae bacterium]|nr:aminopeptidase P family protein [Pelagibacteraceae bacterium]MBT6198025.1 aminopeptidase P family protein [Pelagibacteraceae bacterium]
MNNKINPERGFAELEFEQRLIEAQKVMKSYKLDGILVTTPQNIRYFTGYDSQFWESPTRPWFVVVPASGKPIAIVPEIGESEFKKTWLDEIKSWPSPRPEDDGISLVKSTLEDLNKTYGQIGAEFGKEMTIRMPVRDLFKLKDSVNTNIVNGSDAIWDMRMIKTNAEIERIKFICSIASDAYNELPSKLRIGDTEREAVNKLKIDVLNRGADNVPFMPGISGVGGVSQIVCGPSDRILKNGDILFIDTGSTFDGYFCDFNRNYAFGEISSEVERVHETLWLATEAGIKAAVPGTTTDEIWLAMNTIIQDAGAIGNNVGRLGHGLGLQLTEPPSHRPGDNTRIVENMVLTIEPVMEYAPGKMIVHEENIAITKDGSRLLTKRAPRQMPIIK